MNTTREPATVEQQAELASCLERIRSACADTLEVISVVYGQSDRKALRARELCDSLQRLLWELNRE